MRRNNVSLGFSLVNNCNSFKIFAIRSGLTYLIGNNQHKFDYKIRKTAKLGSKRRP